LDGNHNINAILTSLRCIAWRTSLQPSFPADEKRRIMELFKERKKNRRKKGVKKSPSSANGANTNPGASATTPATANGNGNGVNASASSSVCSGGSAKENAANGEAGAPGNSLSGDFDGKAKALANGNGDNSNTNAEHANPNPSVQINGQEAKDLERRDDKLIEDLTSLPSTKKKKKKKKMKRQLSLNSVSNTDGASSPSKKQELGSNSNSNSNIGESDDPAVKEDVQERSSDDPHRPQNTDLEKTDSSLPPPGFDESMSSLAIDSTPPIQPKQQTSAIDKTLPEEHTTKPQNHESLHGSRCIVIPEQGRPAAPPPQIGDLPGPPRASLAIAAAKVFVDFYYQHITLGLASDLAMYYTSHAQKSISVGGAHSVVATRSDIMLQLQSIARSVFAVRGVVSQDTFDRRGAHILVTGTVVTNGVRTQFAQTISLVPIPQHGPFSFQIHNDALSLLTNGDAMAHSPPQPQPSANNMPTNPNLHHQSHQHQYQHRYQPGNGMQSNPPGLGL
jgi:hypothetical protein